MEDLGNALQATLARIQTLEATNRQLMERAAEQDQKLNFLEEVRVKNEATHAELRLQLREAIREASGGAASSGSQSTRMVDTRGLGKPDKFSNENVEWKSWVFRVVNWFSGSHKSARAVFQWVEDHSDKEAIDEFELVEIAEALKLENAEIAALDADLYMVLVALTSGTAGDIVENGEEGQGLSAYLRLTKQYDPELGGRRRNMLQSILRTPEATLEKLSSAVVQLEKKIRAYEKRQGKSLDEDIKTSTLTEMCPDPLKSHIYLNSRHLDTYAKVRVEVMGYLESRSLRFDVFGDRSFKAGKGRQQVDDPMDIDGLQSGVVCYNCGKTGHYSRDCRYKGAGKKGPGKKGHNNSKGYGDGKKGGKSGYSQGAPPKGGGKNGGKKGSGKHGGKRFDGTCRACGKYGHKEKDCWSAGGRQKTANSVEEEQQQQAAEEPEPTYALDVSRFQIGGLELSNLELEEHCCPPDLVESSSEEEEEENDKIVDDSDDDNDDDDDLENVRSELQRTTAAGVAKPSPRPASAPLGAGETAVDTGRSQLPECSKDSCACGWTIKMSRSRRRRMNRRIREQEELSMTSLGDSDKLSCSTDLENLDKLSRLLEINATSLNDQLAEVSSFHFGKDGDYFYATVDSGAARCVAPKEFASQYPLVQTQESKAGVTYKAANGQTIKNLGRRSIQVVSDEGLDRKLSFEVTGVHKVLLSVSVICDKGHEVYFNKTGGQIVNMTTGEIINMKRVNGVYVIRLKIKPPVGSPDDLCPIEQPSKIDSSGNGWGGPCGRR